MANNFIEEEKKEENNPEGKISWEKKPDTIGGAGSIWRAGESAISPNSEIYESGSGLKISEKDAYEEYYSGVLYNIGASWQWGDSKEIWWRAASRKIAENFLPD